MSLRHKFALEPGSVGNPAIVQPADSSALDAFGRQRVSTPAYVFDSQFTYNLNGLQYEQLTNGAGAGLTHDATNRCAQFAFAAVAANGYSILQTFDHFRYQPGRSQQIFLTFCFIAADANSTKFVGYSAPSTAAPNAEAANGFELHYANGIASFVLNSGTANGNQIVAQSAWNMDKFDGSGPSGITIDWTKTQILLIDFQALYVGRVRMGFIINGVAYEAHRFEHTNLIAVPYIQTANLPIRAGMIATGTSTTTMRFICANVSSESGQGDIQGLGFGVSGTGTAGNTVRAHIISIRPRTTFNNFKTRIKFVLEHLDFINIGNSDVYWELVIGLGTDAAFGNVNTTFSGFEFNQAGNITSGPLLVLHSGYILGTAAGNIQLESEITNRYPITLDSVGAARVNGTLSVLGTGLAAASAMRCAVNWIEIR